MRTVALAFALAVGIPLAANAQEAPHKEPEPGTFRRLSPKQWQEALTRPAAVDRRRAAKLLRGVGHPLYLPMLEAALEDEDAVVRFHVIEILPRYGKYARFAIEPMNAMLKEVQAGRQPPEHGLACLNLIVVLGELAEANLTAVLPFLGHETLGHQAATACSRIGAEPSLRPLIAKLGSEKPTARRWAASALGQLGLEAADAAPALSKLLDDADPIVRAQTILALANIGAPAWEVSVKKIQTLLAEDGVEAVRGQAALALGTIKPAQVDALIKALSDPEIGVRIAAIGGLGQHKGDAAPAAEAIGKLYDGTTNENMRKAIVRALFRIRSPRSIPTMIKVLKLDANKQLRADAANLLPLIGPDSPEAEAALVEALAKGKEHDVGVRAAAALALGKLKTPSPAAEDALRKAALNDPEERVKNCAKYALKQLQHAKTSPGN